MRAEVSSQKPGSGRQNLLEKDKEWSREHPVKFGPVLFGRSVTRQVALSGSHLSIHV